MRNDDDDHPSTRNNKSTTTIIASSVVHRRYAPPAQLVSAPTPTVYCITWIQHGFTQQSMKGSTTDVNHVLYNHLFAIIRGQVCCNNTTTTRGGGVVRLLGGFVAAVVVVRPTTTTDVRSSAGRRSRRARRQHNKQTTKHHHEGIGRAPPIITSSYSAFLPFNSWRRLYILVLPTLKGRVIVGFHQGCVSPRWQRERIRARTSFLHSFSDLFLLRSFQAQPSSLLFCS